MSVVYDRMQSMKSVRMRVFVSTILLYAALCVAGTKIIAALSMLVYVFVLVRITGSIFRSLVVSYAAFLPLMAGKFFPVPLVTPQELHLSWRPLPVSADITVRPADGIVCGMGVYVLWQYVRNKRSIRKLFGWQTGLLVLLPVSAMVSAVVSTHPLVSFWHSVSYTGPLIVYLFARNAKQGEYRLLISALTAAMIAVCGIVFAQYIGGRTLGVVIEQFPGYVPLDEGADAGSMIRLGGTFNHANILAMYLIVSVLTVLPALREARSGGTAAAIGAATAALLLTQSRAAWMSLGIGAGVLVYAARTRLRMTDARRPVFRILLPVITVLVLVVMLPRISRVVRTTASEGGVTMRSVMLSDAWQMFKEHPVLGVGPALDVYAQYSRVRREGRSLLYYPGAVHNGLMQLVIQIGSLGSVLYIFTVYIVVRGALTGKQSLYLTGITAAYAAGLVYGQFQPLLPDLTQLTLFTTMAAFDQAIVPET